ncbi:MAG: NAD-dependent protein deacylase [Abditibacteriota bacterium]|nr:NAD-dependent protein deacylase [Abditibacteriota bacterium]
MQKITGRELPSELLDALKDAGKVFCFTGAGISKESGLPTYRDLDDGMWRNYDPMTFATYEGFIDNTPLVWNNFISRYRQIAAAQPNEGHKALGRMDRYYRDFYVCTQNVDDLHERGGLGRLGHIHGSAANVRCIKCGRRSPVTEELLAREVTEDTIPRCSVCGNILRPDIVWFGETVPIDVLQKSADYAYSCDVFIIIGTSMEVSGGYGLLSYARQGGALTVDVNPHGSAVSGQCDYWLQGPAGLFLPAIADELEAGRA